MTAYPIRHFLGDFAVRASHGDAILFQSLGDPTKWVSVYPYTDSDECLPIPANARSVDGGALGMLLEYTEYVTE